MQRELSLSIPQQLGPLANNLQVQVGHAQEPLSRVHNAGTSPEHTYQTTNLSTIYFFEDLYTRKKIMK